jgi:hypothetical protein
MDFKKEWEEYNQREKIRRSKIDDLLKDMEQTLDKNGDLSKFNNIVDDLGKINEESSNDFTSVVKIVFGK